MLFYDLRRNKTALPREVPWPYESFGRRLTRLSRPASQGKGRGMPGLAYVVASAMSSHMVGALK